MEVAKGRAGEVRSGYKVAATLGAWSVTVAEDRFSDGRFTCTAKVLTWDDYLVAHGQDFSLVLSLGTRSWVWNSVQVTVQEGRVTVTGRGGPKYE